MDSPKYVFSKIPNDAEGHAFVEEMKKYLNKNRYELVKKGQGLMDGVDWRRYTHGQPISKSTHLRIYIKEKR
tara:strand:+ start:82 stop:297 length:216 start_codon:yes stop_codon:yes gene_type:complete